MKTRVAYHDQSISVHPRFGARLRHDIAAQQSSPAPSLRDQSELALFPFAASGSAGAVSTRHDEIEFDAFAVTDDGGEVLEFVEIVGGDGSESDEEIVGFEARRFRRRSRRHLPDSREVAGGRRGSGGALGG